MPATDLKTELPKPLPRFSSFRRATVLRMNLTAAKQHLLSYPSKFPKHKRATAEVLVAGAVPFIDGLIALSRDGRKKPVDEFAATQPGVDA